jgi:hypothetical protein
MRSPFFLSNVSFQGSRAHQKPKETKVSLTKGFDLCSTFGFLKVRRWLNFAIWAALRAAQMAKNRSARSARGTIFRPCRVHVVKRYVLRVADPQPRARNV